VLVNHLCNITSAAIALLLLMEPPLEEEALEFIENSGFV
jgi:hypothetical protein